MDFRKGKGREDPEINLIPFIDVLLVILIFLMVTTTYSKFTELQITLPTADAEKATDHPFEINVGVDAQNRYAINNTPIAFNDPAGLADEMKKVANEKGENRRDPIVIINADAQAPHQSVINILQAARLAGFDRVTFASQTSGKK
ncbi:MAG: biopolymer transporter ExbD [Burkholderiales bacterium]|nr:biopolymer transporter ExbD [Burkholderiales bacterium]